MQSYLSGYNMFNIIFLVSCFSEEPTDYSHDNDVSGVNLFGAPPSGHPYQQRPAMNGQLGGSYNNMALNHMHSPNSSVQSGGSSVQVTQKVCISRGPSVFITGPSVSFIAIPHPFFLF